MTKAQATTKVDQLTKDADPRRPSAIFNTKSRPSLGVGKFVMQLIKDEPALTTHQILERVYDHFPIGSIKTSKSCIAWYKAKARTL